MLKELVKKWTRRKPVVTDLQREQFEAALEMGGIVLYTIKAEIDKRFTPALPGDQQVMLVLMSLAAAVAGVLPVYEGKVRKRVWAIFCDAVPRFTDMLQRIEAKKEEVAKALSTTPD